MKYLVSGATGFVGRELCSQLKNGSMQYTALSRSGGTLPDGKTTVALDFASTTVPTELLHGVDVVFHLAGIAHQQAQEDTYTRVNHQATLALAEASAAAGVKCFIFLSSVKAMGPSQDDAARNEEEISVPTNAYGLSKLQAEHDLRAAFSDSEMSVVILRPSLVYGPSLKGNLLSLSRAVRAGMPCPPEEGGRSMVAVQDLAGLMLQIAANPPRGVHTWIVSDGQQYSSRRIYDLMRAAAGKRPGASWLPLWAWRFASFMVDGMRNRGVDSTFQKLFGTELYSSAALLRDLSWRPELKFSDTVHRIMDDSQEGAS